MLVIEKLGGGGVGEHGDLTGLSDDDHSIYALLAGRSGGQILIGGSDSSDDLLLQSTSHGTKGTIAFGSLTDGLIFDETNVRLSIGGPETSMTVGGVTKSQTLSTHITGGSQDYTWASHVHSNTVGPVIAGARTGGSEASPSIVSDGDNLLDLLALGYDGTDYETAAAIHLDVGGTPGDNDMPGRITFFTTPTGSTTLAERLRIDSAGNVGIGTTSAGAKLEVVGRAIIEDGANDNVFVTSGNDTLTGNSNTGMGGFSLSNNSTGNRNTAYGYSALRNVTTGQENTSIGAYSLPGNVFGSDNVAVGYRAGNSGAGSAFDQNDNVFLGSWAGSAIITGADRNVIIGKDAALTLTTGTDNIIIGQGVDVSSASVTNELNIGNLIYGNMSAGNVGINVVDPDTQLEVLGSTGVKISFDGTDNTTLVTDTNGDLTITPSGSSVIVAGDIEIGSTNAIQYGDPAVDTSWQTIRDGTKLSFQRRESSAWVEKGFFDMASFHSDAFHAEAAAGVAGSYCWHPGTTPEANPDGPRLWVDSSGDAYLLEQNASPTTRVQHKMVMEDANGNVSIGTDSPYSNGLTIANSVDPHLYFQETGAPADNKLWDIIVENEKMSFNVVNDANTIAQSFLSIDRTGPTIDNVAFPNGNISIGGSFIADSILHLKANTSGTVGDYPAGQIIIQNPANDPTANVVITAYKSDVNGDPDEQLWYLGSSSGSNANITFLNRRNANLALGTNGTTRMTILGSGKIGIGVIAPAGTVHIRTADSSITPDVYYDDLVVENNGSAGITIGSGTTDWGGLAFAASGADQAGFIGYNHNSNFMAFWTDATERMRIDSSGFVGINEGTPTSILSIKGDGNSGFANSSIEFRNSGTSGRLWNCGIRGDGDGSNQRFFISDETAGTERFKINANGTVVLTAYSGSGNETAEFDPTGELVRAASDARLKRIYGKVEYGIKELSHLQPMFYNFLTESPDAQRQIGFIAQNVQENIPEAVGMGSDGYLTFRLRGVVATLVNAVKEQQAQIEELKNLINQ